MRIYVLNKVRKRWIVPNYNERVFAFKTVHYSPNSVLSIQGHGYVQVIILLRRSLSPETKKLDRISNTQNSSFIRIQMKVLFVISATLVCFSHSDSHLHCWPKMHDKISLIWIAFREVCRINKKGFSEKTCPIRLSVLQKPLWWVEKMEKVMLADLRNWPSSLRSTTWRIGDLFGVKLNWFSSSSLSLRRHWTFRICIIGAGHVEKNEEGNENPNIKNMQGRWNLFYPLVLIRRNRFKIIQHQQTKDMLSFSSLSPLRIEDHYRRWKKECLRLDDAF